MVTFRFYVVTTAALFLALAIGIVVGSALDERLVAGLESQVARVQSNLDDTADAIDTKNREIDQLQQYVEESAPFAVDGQLPDTTLVVVAEEGIDAEPVEDLVRRGRQAGAHAEGVVWLDPRWQLADVADRQELSAALDLDGGSAVTVRGDAWTGLVTSMADLIGASIVAPGASDSTDATIGDATTTTTSTTTSTTTLTTLGSTTTTAGSDAPGDDSTTTVDAVELFNAPTLAALDDSGFVRLQPVEGAGPAAGTNLAVVFVTGQDSEFESPASVLEELSTMTSDLGVPTVVAEVYRAPEEDQEFERASTLGAWRASDAGLVSTVDDLDLVAGRVATILALAELRTGVGGHYGYGPDADAVLPEWPGP